MFPDLDMLGIDLVLPDFTYLRENADRIIGCIATHGHEDHTGGLSFLLRELEFPIYGSALTLGLARNRIEEAGLLDRTEFIQLHEFDSSESDTDALMDQEHNNQASAAKASTASAEDEANDELLRSLGM